MPRLQTKEKPHLESRGGANAMNIVIHNYFVMVLRKS